MKHRWWQIGLLCGSAVFLSAGAGRAEDASLAVGVATVDITPGDNYPMSGYYHERLSTGVKDPLLAKAIVFRQDDRAAAIVALPGEVFVELGLAIKNASPFKTTLVIELSNAIETVYVPHRFAYVGGGYEVVNSTLLPGGGELLAEAAIRLLAESAAELEPIAK